MRERLIPYLLILRTVLGRLLHAALTPWRQLLKISLVKPLQELHTGFYARAVGYYRTREIVRVFEANHLTELTNTPINLWPKVQARQRQEIALIKAGQFDITDRKSWQWPWLPQNVSRFSMPVAKFLPYSLRRMSRTPIPRRAINLIKNAVTSQVWDVRVREHIDPIDDYQDERIRIAKEIFSHPNNVDSFQTFVEQGIEDIMVPGAFVAELRYTPLPDRPIKMWTINAESIRLFASWTESTPDQPRYCQMTGLKGERGALLFYDDEVLFIKDNPSTDNPYGLGKMEVAFQAINALLGVHAMGSRAASDQIHKTWLWWEQTQAACYDADTQVLTKRGWIYWEDAREEELFATRNAQGEFEWQQATKLHKYDYSGQLVQFRNRAFDIRVTPNHRMLGRYLYKKQEENGPRNGNKRTRKRTFYWSEELFAEAAEVFCKVTSRPGKERRLPGEETVTLAMPSKCHPEAPDPNCERCRNRLVMRRLQDRKRKGIVAKSAEPSPLDFRIPTQSKWNGYLPAERIQIGQHSFDWKDWAAFLGIWMAEGHTSGSSLQPKPLTGLTLSARAEPCVAQREYAARTCAYKVAIAQSKTANPEKFNEIEALLVRMGLSFYEVHPSAGCGFMFTDREIWEHLAAFGNKHTKYVPEYIKEAPTEIINEFLNWAVKGDGHIRPSGARGYTTVSARLADDMQELFQKVGSSAAIETRQPQNGGLIKGRRVKSRSTRYNVVEYLEDEVSLTPSFTKQRAKEIYKPKLIAYTGPVYCATVPNGTLYARRNGRAFWSGNSQYDIIRRHIQNEMEGQARVSIIGGMKKPDVLEIQPTTEDDLLLGWQEMLIRVIANAFDLSPLALGLERDVNRSTGETMSDMDFRNAVVPLATRIQEAFTRKILHERLGWKDLEFVFPNLNQPSNDAKMDLNARLYTTNSTTPNEIRKSMGFQPSPNPFYDLTQMEVQLLMVQAQGDIQDRNSDRTMGRQSKMQSDMMDKQTKLMQQQQQQPSDEGGDGRPNQENPGGNEQQASAETLRQYRQLVAGTNYTVQEIYEMTIPTLMQLLANGSLPKPKVLLRNLKAQQAGVAPKQPDPNSSTSGVPGVSFLEHMGQEVREFLEGIEEYQDTHPKASLTTAIKNQWALVQSERLKKDAARMRDFEQWIYQNRLPAGTPGHLGRDAKLPAPNPQRNRRRN